MKTLLFLLTVLLGLVGGVTNAATINIKNSSKAPAQNIAVNVPNQVLGGLEITVTDSPAKIYSAEFDVDPRDSIVPNLKSTYIVDINGSVVAGPVDAHGVIDRYPIRFNDTITIPIGTSTYWIVGRIGDGVENAQNFRLMLSGITYDLDHESLIQFPVALSAMTARKASLAIRTAANPEPQMVVAGAANVTFVSWEFDATQSSEDVRVSVIPTHLTYTGGAGTDISSCQLFDGSTVLTTGSAIVNPDTSASSAPYLFTLDHYLVIPKGTIKTVALKGNMSLAATSFVGHWDITTSDISALNVTGITSAQPVKAKGSGTGPTFVVIPGGSTKALIESTLKIKVVDECNCPAFVLSFLTKPGYRYNVQETLNLTEPIKWEDYGTATANSTNIDWAVESASQHGNKFYRVIELLPSRLRVSNYTLSPSVPLVTAWTYHVNVNNLVFRASYEDVALQRIGLKLGHPQESSPSDIMTVHIFDGNTEVGLAFFTGDNNTAISTLTSPVYLTRDVDKVLTINVDTSPISNSAAVTRSGHHLSVEYDDGNTECTSATGIQSGTRIYATGSTTSPGVRIMKSFPVVTQNNQFPTAGLTANVPLLRFGVTADIHGAINVAKLKLQIATSQVSVTLVNVFAFTDSAYSQPISGVSSGGRLMVENANPDVTGRVAVYPQTLNGTPTSVQVSAGDTVYFEVRSANVTQVLGATNYKVTTTLLGDNDWPTPFMNSFVGINSDPVDANFIWSPNSVTMPYFDYPDWGGGPGHPNPPGYDDWTNGYSVPGLPSNGIRQVRTN